jgi:hypothetical protein
MAYTASSLAALLQNGGFTFWRYATNDTRATVTAAGYFASAASRLRAGDLMLLQTSDAVALLPVRTGPSLGPGTTLDGAVGPIATVRSVGFNFTVTQSVGVTARTIDLAPLAAGIVVGSSIPVSAMVTGAVASVVFGVYDSAGAAAVPEVTAPVIGGIASAILQAPGLGNGYRVRARDAANPAMAVRSFAFSVGPDLEFLLQEDDRYLLLEVGSGLKQN